MLFSVRTVMWEEAEREREQEKEGGTREKEKSKQRVCVVCEEINIHLKEQQGYRE